MLLVPIALDVLVLREPEGQWARTAMRVPEPPPAGTPAERQRLLPPPFSNLDEGRPPGAYLHWALADGLTRLIPDEEGGASLHAVPSRWLVLRLTGPPTPHRRLDAWLLPNVHAETPEVIDDALSLTEPVPAGQAGRPLTGAGHGDLGWSAYFDNVTNRLGFHDSLEDVTGPVAYLVCGWYTHEELDPLHPPPDGPWSESAFDERIEELGWYVDGPVVDPIPTRTLYHGSAVAIAWPGTTWAGDGDGELSAEHGGPPDPGGVEVTIGETIAAAIARLVAGDADPIDVTRLVEGMALHALGEVAEAGGTSRLESALHASRFGEMPSAGHRETIFQAGDVAGGILRGPLGGPSDGRAVEGGLMDAIGAVVPGSQREARTDGAGALTSVGRSSPRLFHPIDPCLAVAGAGRSYRHGGDRRFDERGLRCRYAGQTVSALGPPDAPSAPGADVLPDWEIPGTPPEVHALLEEAASLDPGSAPDLEAGQEPSPVAAARAAWWTSWEPDAGDGDPPPFVVTGVPPSPVAVTPPTRPWTPLHLDWELHWLPSPRGAKDWGLGEVDYELPESGPALGEHQTFTGRAPLTPGGADVLADLGEGLADRDVLTGALSGFLDRVRGVPEGQLVPSEDDTPEEPYPVTALRAGVMELRRLRVIDTYGQVVDLLGSGPSDPVAPGRLGIHDDLAVPGHPDLVAQVPRFTAPARILLRYVDAIDGSEDIGPGVSPVCGFLMPTKLDGTLAFLDAEGRNLGRLVPDPATGTAWEEEPGLPAALGRLPGRLIENPILGALGDGLLRFDTVRASARPDTTASALDSMLRVLDTTGSTVDATGAAGDTHLALLLGRPVAVLRARITLEINDEAGAETNAATSVAVRLGSLAHPDDGLLGYFARGDFSLLHAIDPAVVEQAPPRPGTPPADIARGGYVDDSGIVWVQPGRPVELALLVAPGADVRVTTGLLPAKSIGVRREWLNAWLEKLTPTLRAGPVLRDPRTTRLPVSTEVRGTWSWHRRPEPGAWASDPVLADAGEALLPETAPALSEGWLRVQLAPEVRNLPLAAAFRITCIEQASSGAPISAVGGKNPDGSRWTVPVGQAVRMLESGRFRFTVQVEGHDTEVVIGRSATGRKYLRTESDTTQINNLLSLPQCEE